MNKYRALIRLNYICVKYIYLFANKESIDDSHICLSITYSFETINISRYYFISMLWELHHFPSPSTVFEASNIVKFL